MWYANALRATRNIECKCERLAARKFLRLVWTDVRQSDDCGDDDADGSGDASNDTTATTRDDGNSSASDYGPPQSATSMLTMIVRLIDCATAIAHISARWLRTPPLLCGRMVAANTLLRGAVVALSHERNGGARQRAFQHSRHPQLQYSTTLTVATATATRPTDATLRLALDWIHLFELDAGFLDMYVELCNGELNER